jgi:phospholipase/carboxylesterase
MNLVHAIHEPEGDGPHPTLIALHGWGASALDLLGLAPHLAGGRFLVLCPQGGVRVPIGPNAVGYGWFPITMGSPPDPAAFESANDQLLAFLDAATRRHPIDVNKTAIMGFSQGGVMAYALALRQPKRFAALAALSTWLPPVLAGVGEKSLDNLPVLVQHGTRDPMIDIGRGRDSVERLRGLGASVVYREYEMEHEINAASLHDLNGFLQERMLSRLWTAG